ncbi:MAG: type 2 isopentenyl-diphosphate Delta-isomerase [Anaerolineaceae bacterium]|nr:type 2 isopentenyl-diphosphate Delta-isomerase [Anaerolineaceae bacterium]
MSPEIPIEKRKNEHLKICLHQDVSSSLANSLDAIRLRPSALPELDLKCVNIQTRFLGHLLSAPILISSMTGGSSQTARLNEVFAEAAESCQIAIALGSQRAAIQNSVYESTYAIRKLAPHALIVANLGAIQLNNGFNVDSCKKAIEIAGADAIFLHLNALQEALQPEGDTNWSDLLRKIENLARDLDRPLLVKEVGWGIDKRNALRLQNAGVAAIDVAGAGGTSWSQVEYFRQQEPSMRQIAADFRGWGLATLECLRELAQEPKLKIPFIASGGLRHGIDLAKCLALGASLGGYARCLLPAADRGTQALIAQIEAIKKELQIALFACGAADLSACNQSLVLGL